MFKVNGLCIGALVIVLSSVIVQARNLNCSGDGHQIEMLWDSQVSPIGPAKVSIDGKEIMLGGAQMAFDKGASIYTIGDMKVTFQKGDLEKNSFSTVAQLKGQDIKLNCKNENGKKAKTEVPKKTRDLVTRIAELHCVGDGHDLDVKWDSAASPLGPVSIIWSGREIPLGGMRMAIDKEGSHYELQGIKFTTKNADASKKSFASTVQYMGRDIQMKCTKNENMEFLRKRDVEKSAPSGDGASQ